MPDWILKFLDQVAVVTTAPMPFAIALILVGAVIWVVVGWSYSVVLNSKNAQIELQDRQIAALKESEPKGPSAAQPLQFATEKDSLIIPIAPNKFTVLFRVPMRATPTLKFVEPDAMSSVQPFKLEYWSPLGFTVEFPQGTPYKQLRFTADAHAAKP